MKPAFSLALIVTLVLCLSHDCFADFQYTETSKITGGSAAGAMKVAGVFSKGAREATHGTISTISLKGHRMRREDSLGMVEIIDLDGRRIMHIDSKKKTYSVMTFDEMRAQMEQARRKAAEQQAKHGKGQPSQVKIVPKVKISAGTGAKTLLDYSCRQMKVRVDMEIQSDDPQAKGQTANTWVNSDSWIAPVKGYDELKRFYLQMAKELDWVPGAVLGANPQVTPAMVEYRKSTASLNGMPLLSNVSVGMAGQPGAAQPSSQDGQKQSGGNPITHGIGGLFGKKKKSDLEQNDSGKSGASSSSSTGNSLLDTTIEVTSVSTKPVDAALFAIPQGYKQVQAK